MVQTANQEWRILQATSARRERETMICEHTNRKSERCGLPEEAIIHMDGWIGGHRFEPSVPVAKLQPAAPAAPAAEPANTWARRNEYAQKVADNGPQVDTRRVPTAHYFCAECGKTPELCHHFSSATQATEARKLIKLAEYIWNVRVTALEMPRLKDEFIRKVLQDLEEGIL